MGRRAAHIEVLDGRPVVRPAGHRPQKKQLFERQLALKDVSLRQPEFALEVEWRQHLPPDNNLFQIGREFRDRVDHVVAEPLALLVPRAVAFRQFVRRVLHEAGEHVLARRRDRWIRQARNHDVDIRPPREVAVFRVVVRPLHVLDARRNRNRAPQVRAGARETSKIRQRFQRQIHLAGRPAKLVTPHVFQKFNRQLVRLEEFLER